CHNRYRATQLSFWKNYRRRNVLELSGANCAIGMEPIAEAFFRNRYRHVCYHAKSCSRNYSYRRQLAPLRRGAACCALQHAVPSNPNVQPGSLGAIIRSFKSAVTKRYNEEHGRSGLEIWQRNYYEHIIRDERAFD